MSAEHRQTPATIGTVTCDHCGYEGTFKLIEGDDQPMTLAMRDMVEHQTLNPRCWANGFVVQLQTFK